MDLNLAEFLKIPSQPEKRGSETFAGRVPLTSKRGIELLMEGKLGSKVCKFCLHVESNMYEMGQIFEIAGKKASCKVTVRDMVGCIYPFETVNDNELPQSICNKCLNRTISSYLFAQQIDRSERALHNFVEDMNDKFDKLDPLERPKKRGRQKTNPNSDTLYAAHEFVYDYADPQMCLVNKGNDLKKDTISPLECPKCWRRFSSIELRMSHEIVHPDSMWYCCRICGYSFPKHQGYKRHIRETHDAPVVVKTPSLTCQCKCGNITENYSEHLQHIEKHKFRTIMQSMVSGKMDKLCVICLGKERGMVSLDMKLRLHGGYPEVTGDRSLHNILNTTLPDQNQTKANQRELTVLNVAKRMKMSWNAMKTKRTIEVDKQPKDNTNIFNYTFSNPTVCNMTVNRSVNKEADENNAAGSAEVEATVHISDVPEANNNNIQDKPNANTETTYKENRTGSHKRKHEEDINEVLFDKPVDLEAVTEIEPEKSDPQIFKEAEIIEIIDKPDIIDTLNETQEESLKITDVHEVDRIANEKAETENIEHPVRSENVETIEKLDIERVVTNETINDETNTKAVQINLDIPKEIFNIKDNIAPGKDAETQTDGDLLAPKQVLDEKAVQTEYSNVAEKGVQVDKEIVIKNVENEPYNEMDIDEFVENNKTIVETSICTISNNNIPNFSTNSNNNCLLVPSEMNENSVNSAIITPKPQAQFAFRSDNDPTPIIIPKTQTPFAFGLDNTPAPINAQKTPAPFMFSSNKTSTPKTQAPFTFSLDNKSTPINAQKTPAPFIFGSDDNRQKTLAPFMFGSENKYSAIDPPKPQIQFTIGSDSKPKTQSQFVIGAANKYDQCQNMNRRVIKAKRRRP